MSEQSERSVARRNPFFSEFGFPARWEPFRSLLDDLFVETPAGARSLSPSVDITEADDKYCVRAELPGIAKSDVTIELEGGVLNVRGEKKTRRDEKLEKGRRLECSYGAFSRSFALPQDADAERISADYKDGILEISIPKRPESKPKQIAVKG